MHQSSSANLISPVFLSSSSKPLNSMSLLQVWRNAPWRTLLALVLGVACGANLALANNNKPTVQAKSSTKNTTQQQQATESDDTIVEEEQGIPDIASLVANNNNLTIRIDKMQRLDVSKYLHPNCKLYLDNVTQHFNEELDSSNDHKDDNIITAPIQRGLKAHFNKQVEAIKKLPRDQQEYACLLYNLRVVAPVAPPQRNTTGNK